MSCGGDSAEAPDGLDVRAPTTLLVDGAAGGVGSVAVQLAIARGARVILTGRPENQTFIAQFGAIPVTYGQGLAERVRALDIERVDLALDVAGAGSLPDLIAITGTAASVLTIADFTGPQLGVRLLLGEPGGEPDGRHGLTLAAALSEERRFRRSRAGSVPHDPGSQSTRGRRARTPAREDYPHCSRRSPLSE